MNPVTFEGQRRQRLITHSRRHRAPSTAELKRKAYEAQLLAWLSGNGNGPSTQAEAASCCGSGTTEAGDVCQIPKTKPAEPVYKSPYESWLKAKNPIKRWAGHVLDWFSWFVEGIRRDLNRVAMAVRHTKPKEAF